MKNDNSTELSNACKPMLAVVSDDMRKFGEQYAFFIITTGQRYINTLSPHFTTESIMEIFIRDYWSKDWLNNR
jgi:hypothetical protein